jgi:acyl carrier protein
MLKQEKVGIDDNFFELGGDSMMGLELVSQAADQLDIHDLSVIAVFEYPTIREMAQFIEALAAESESPAFVEFRNGGEANDIVLDT